MTNTLPKLALSVAVSAALAACGGSSGDSGGGVSDENLDGIEDVTLTTDEDGDGQDDIDVDGDGRADFDVNEDGIRDTDVNGDGSVDLSVLDEFGLLAGFDTDADGEADLDIDRQAITQEPTVTPVSAENPCGDATGSDNNSSNADWSDNCTISRANQHSESTYSAGIQRIVYCAGLTSSSSVDAFTDGDFGAGTQAAVEQFQRDNDLVDDGIVGGATWAELREALTDAAVADSDDFLQEFYGVEGALCSSSELFIANNSGEFEDSELVIDSWALTQGENNRQSVEFGVQELAVD